MMKKVGSSYLPWLSLLVLLIPSPLYANDRTVETPKADNSFERPGHVNIYQPSIHLRRPKVKFTEHLAFSVHMDFYSRYVWRGFAASQGPVWQPSFTFSFYGVGISVWANFVMGNEPNQGEFNEVDFYLFYHRKVKNLVIDASLLNVLYPGVNSLSDDAGNPSLEFDLLLSYALGPIDVFSFLAVRFISAPGSIYWEGGLGYQKKLPKNFILQTSALVAVGDGRFNEFHVAPGVGTQLNLFEFNLSFDWMPYRGVHLVPSVQVSTLLPQAIRDQIDHDPTIVRGGLSFIYNHH